MGFQGKPSARGAYDAIVYIDGSEVVAEDADGRKIASGVAGTDDATVIQAVLSSFSNGQRLVIKSGVYSINAELSINDSGISIIGEPSLMYYDPSVPKTVCGTVLSAANALDSIIKINGNYATLDGRAYCNIDTILFYGGNRAFATNGLDVNNGSGLNIRNVHFYNIKGHAVDVSDSFGMNMNDCVFYECGDDDDGSACIRVLNDNISSTFMNIERCAFENGYYAWSNIPRSSIDYLKISHCYIERSTNTEFNGLIIPDVADIHDNFFTGVFNGYLILGSATSAVASSVKIHHNTIKGGGFGGAGGAIKIDGYSDVEISGNHFLGTTEDAVYLKDSYSSRIVNNIFMPTLGAVAGKDGITVVSSDPDLIISGNQFRQLTGRAIDGTWSNSMISNNVFALCAYGIYFNASKTGHILSNNIFHDCGTNLNSIPTGTKMWGNVGYPTESSGPSTGTGSEQTIAHGLAAIPTGCKAWIKYLVGSRYITEMVPFDATNVYPTVTSGLAYEWRIE